jgi:outer membrane protein assembly factor BamB
VSAREQLFIGIGGKVVAIDPSTGEERWRTKLASSSITTVGIVGGALYAAAQGELSRLDPATGTILWTNKLSGLGLGVLTFPGADAGGTAAAVAHARAQAAAQ